ncbi:HlyD family type I secretion periplasmic adaptor subunit [Tepidiphilus olei]|uniref:HlyD family type I secretion periplasmic adaptor subunit n=1 Tax=Tepidiphilus olei TaxID=2502184 RepID=UPI00115E4CF7|nr:HlyD family type I secretion periplasmic adaptor subunit [Tepidiphilus olei]
MSDEKLLTGPAGRDLTIDGAISPVAVAEEHLPHEAKRFLRVGVWILVLLVGGFFAWAAFAPLDAGVPAQGVTIVESKRKTVAHLTGGIVKEILVRDMQLVRAGEPLVVLDETTASAQYESVNKEYLSLLAMKARLEAERADAREIHFPLELIEAAKTEPEAARQMALQRDLFAARRSALASDLRVFEEQVRTYSQDAASKRVQLALLQEQLEGIRSLAAEGYAPQAQRLELERQALDLQARLDLSLRQADEARLRAAQRREEYRKEVESQLAEVAKQVAVLDERRRALREDLSRTVIRAPVDGYVNALAVHTVGGVVRPGEPLMELIPTDERLEFEVRVPAHLIEHVYPGLKADVMLQNFSKELPHPLEGEVVSVSADLVIDKDPNVPPHYVARVRLTEQGLGDLGHRVLQPGMPVSVVIKTGERTFLHYLVDPLLRRVHQSLTEQ